MEKCRKVEVTFGDIKEGDDYGLLEYWAACIKDDSTGPHENELRGAFLITDYYRNYCYTWSRKDHYKSLNSLKGEFTDLKELFGWLYKESIVFVGRLYEGEHITFDDDELTSFEVSIIIEMLEEAKNSYDLYGVPRTISFDDDLFHKCGLKSKYTITNVNDINGIIDILNPYSEKLEDTNAGPSLGGGLSS